MARSHITTGVCHSADMPTLQRCQANTAQTFWPQTPAACVINTRYCTCRRSGIYTKCITFPCCPGHTQETQHELNTTLPRVGCVRMQVYVCVQAQMSKDPGGAFCPERVRVCLSAVLHRRSETNSSPSIRPHTRKHMPYTHDQPIP